MNNYIIIDKAKALKKWTPVLDSLQIRDEEKRTWMSEYAEMHQLNENVGYSTLGNINGMGAVVAPVVSTIPGQTWGAGNAQGSGDVAQNLLPVSMKIAAQTIGLDLVAVKPSSSSRIEMLFVDFKYDNNGDSTGTYERDERPLVFKLNSLVSGATYTAQLTYAFTLLNIHETVGGLDGRTFVKLSGGTAAVYFAASPTSGMVTTEPAVSTGRQGWLEFLGFSKVDGFPMFRTFRQINTAANNTATWAFDPTRNTFPSSTASIVSMLNGAEFVLLSGASNVLIAGASVELVSTMEDQLPGFSAGWNLNQGMTRAQDEETYPGVIGPDVFTKSIQVGDIEISSTLKRTQIEDIKAATGMDIVQKLESVLVNELTQTISKQIVAKIRVLADENRVSHTCPKAADGVTSKFDYDVDAAMVSALGLPGGDTYTSMQRKLVSKINNASNFIATDGRVGPAQYLVTNGNIASILQDVQNYSVNPPAITKMNTNGQLYPAGNIGNIAIYVDPYMLWSDNRIFLGRKNSVDQPGLVFIPYLMAQSISLISEATWAPRMLIRSRYAVADIGFFPQKQFMTIKVTDTNGILI